MKSPKVTLTVTIRKINYEKLKMIITSGKVSEVVDNLIEEWLEKREKEIANEYQQESEDKEHNEQVKSWYLIHRSRVKIKTNKQSEKPQ